MAVIVILSLSVVVGMVRIPGDQPLLDRPSALLGRAPVRACMPTRAWCTSAGSRRVMAMISGVGVGLGIGGQDITWHQVMSSPRFLRTFGSLSRAARLGGFGSSVYLLKDLSS